MAPTVEYLEERFDTFNRMCFDGALPRIPIKLSNARGFVGRLQYRPVRDWRGRVVRHEDFVLRISRHFDLTEAEVEDTLIHEMIHLWIAVNGIRDSSTHGRAFRAKMKEINTLYGRHLTISHKSTPEELDRDTRIRRMLRWSPTVRSSVRFDSRDPWFNRFPRCRTAKLFPVEPEELRKHMNEELFVSCSP